MPWQMYKKYCACTLCVDKKWTPKLMLLFDKNISFLWNFLHANFETNQQELRTLLEKPTTTSILLTFKVHHWKYKVSFLVWSIFSNLFKDDRGLFLFGNSLTDFFVPYSVAFRYRKTLINTLSSLIKLWIVHCLHCSVLTGDQLSE